MSSSSDSDFWGPHIFFSKGAFETGAAEINHFLSIKVKSTCSQLYLIFDRRPYVARITQEDSVFNAPRLIYLTFFYNVAYN